MICNYKKLFVQYKRYKDNNPIYNIFKYFVKLLQVHFFYFLHQSLGTDQKVFTKLKSEFYNERSNTR